MSRYKLDGHTPHSPRMATDTHINRQVQIVGGWESTSKTKLLTLCERLQKVRSKHVVDVYDVVDLSGGYGLVLEYLPTPENLGQITNSADRTLKLKTSLATVTAVYDLHKAGVSHGHINATCWGRDDEGILNLTGFTKAASIDDAPQHAKDFVAIKNLITSMTINPILRTRLESSPDIVTLHKLIHSELLRDQHRAMIVIAGKVVVLDRTNRMLTLTHPGGIAHVVIEYTGTEFIARDVKGEVLLNNQRALEGQVLEGACVIALGDPHRKFSERYHLSWEQSAPEWVQ